MSENNPTEAQKDLYVAQGEPAALRDTLQVGVSQGFTVISGGNPDLVEAEADTLTVGLVVVLERLPQLSFAIDYFHVEVEKAVTQVCGQALVSSCFDTLDAGMSRLPFPAGSLTFPYSRFSVRAYVRAYAQRTRLALTLEKF